MTSLHYYTLLLAALPVLTTFNCSGDKSNRSFEPTKILQRYEAATGNEDKDSRKDESETREDGKEEDTTGSLNAASFMAAPVNDEKILKREGYTVSYNRETRQPNYVVWLVTPGRLTGTAKRSSSFFEDPELEEAEKSTLDDYRSSGYDRGHLCPAGDNKWSRTAMVESFLLSNICPQKHALNAGDWKELEEFCRSWVENSGGHLYIVAGPLFNDGNHKRLKRHVRVPDKFFKILLCLDKNQEKAIAFIYNNDNGQHPIDSYVHSIDEVEKISGFDFFYKLDKTAQAKLERQKRLDAWLNNTDN